MNSDRIKQQLSSLALSMFRKDFFGIYHGSLSAKLESNLFVINTKEAIFDNFGAHNMIELYYNKDYRWNEASIDSDIHLNIYKQISDAKFITFSMPPFTTAYTLNVPTVVPKDYFGYKELGTIEVYDPKKFDDWYDRASSEIPHYLLSKRCDIMVIRGYGVYAYNRDLHRMAKRLAILEKSCRMLMLDNALNRLDLDL